MSSILKSESDLKDYRIVALPNGLKALLISDLHSKKTNVDDDGGDHPDDEEMCDGEDRGHATDEEMGDSEHEENDSEGEDVVDSGPDDEDGMSQMKNRKKSQKTEKMAAAALCIGIGSFSDPPDIPGLAHFLEHMVFMGSEKYPDENSFDAFIKKHGGSDNASTDCERFEIHQKYFQEALLRFAQFFIAPLLKENSTDRELEAVDSEFQMSLPSDTHRKAELLGSMCVDGHPMGKFMWGNTESIKLRPLEGGINVYQRLREFRERHYSAQYMTLVVQSQETLDHLEEWVASSFSDVSHNDLKKETFGHCGHPFHQEKFLKLYKVVPVKNYQQVEITWALPPLAKHYKSKPLQYLAWLVGHEGIGSILALLKKRALGLCLCAGNMENGFELNSTYSSFGIMVTLTDAGFEQVLEVIKIMFQYLKMLKESGPQERIYKEIKTIDDNDFRFQEEEDPVERVELLSENLQLYPEEHILTGHLLKFEYDPEIYAECVDRMTIDKANIMLYSKKYETECTLEEYWYKTKYSVQDVPAEWVTAISDLKLNPELHLPKPNKFIATNFDLKEADREDTEYPVCVLDTPQSKIWYKRDTKFKTARGYIFFHLITPLVNESVLNLVLFDYMVSILEHNLSEVGYDADVADLQYIFKTEETGLLVKINGFNHKLPDLFETITDYLAGFSVTDDLFESVKQSMVRSYFNHNITKDKLNTDVRLSVLQEKKFIPLDKATVVQGVTKDQVLSFAEGFKRELFLEGLIQGNFTSAEAIGFESYLRQKLGCKALPSDRHPSTRVVKLNRGEHICRVRGLGPTDKNTVVTNYYQWGPGSVEMFSMVNALVVMMEEPCFDVLRTQEQLGYSVHPTCRNSFGVLGFSVTVTTQATKFSAAHVDRRIDAFLQHLHDEIMSSYTDDTFNELIQGIINSKMCADLHLGEEAKRNWFEVKDQSYLFDRLHREVEYFRKLTLQNVRDFLGKHLKTGECYRKLSTQVIGVGEHEQFNLPVDMPAGTMMAGEGEGDKMDITEPDAEQADLKLDMLPLENGYTGLLIDDIVAFKQSLEIYPACRLDH